jgi:hypothetical protein
MNYSNAWVRRRCTASWAGLVPPTTIIIAMCIKISGRRRQLNPSDRRSPSDTVCQRCQKF